VSRAEDVQVLAEAALTEFGAVHVLCNNAGVGTSRATLGPALDAALDPERVADVVLDAIREQRFYILPHPEEAIDMAEQQLRWMRTNEPLVPGLGVARAAD
jgi:NAD(P)-dependent dehydrogenase (short-subunit alcohol dehydrogenase family)